jgi:NTE family protein
MTQTSGTEQMDINTMINNAGLKKELFSIRQQLQKPDAGISDVIDGEGNQYVDLVMEGGGMLGIALVGYTWALEQMGIRFLGVGGTSAGAINALLLAALDIPSNPKSPMLLEILANKNFYEFVDGNKDAKGLIELALNKKATFKAVRMLWQILKVKNHVCTNYGLNKGDAFFEWLNKLLTDSGIKTLYDLDLRLSTPPPGLRLRNGKLFTDADRPSGRLVIVAADVTTETRVEFPKMANLYWADPQSVPPALFARASMSVPLFFEPLRIDNIPQGEKAENNWEELAGYGKEDPTEAIPETVMFVDGGVVSNFPIDAFHCIGRVPRMPTFGVKLEYDQRCKLQQQFPPYADGKFSALLPLLGTVFNSARHTLDYEFIKKNPDYKNLVEFIPCTYKDTSGKIASYGWLDFNMPDSHKEALFNQGARKAIKFIKEFSAPFGGHSNKWEYYKQLRRGLIEQTKKQTQEITS